MLEDIDKKKQAYESSLEIFRRLHRTEEIKSRDKSQCESDPRTSRENGFPESRDTLCTTTYSESDITTSRENREYFSDFPDIRDSRENCENCFSDLVRRVDMSRNEEYDILSSMNQESVCMNYEPNDVNYQKNSSFESNFSSEPEESSITRTSAAAMNLDIDISLSFIPTTDTNGRVKGITEGSILEENVKENDIDLKTIILSPDGGVELLESEEYLRNIKTPVLINILNELTSGKHDELLPTSVQDDSEDMVAIMEDITMDTVDVTMDTITDVDVSMDTTVDMSEGYRGDSINDVLTVDENARELTSTRDTLIEKDLDSEQSECLQDSKKTVEVATVNGHTQRQVIKELREIKSDLSNLQETIKLSISEECLLSANNIKEAGNEVDQNNCSSDGNKNGSSSNGNKNGSSSNGSRSTVVISSQDESNRRSLETNPSYCHSDSTYEESYKNGSTQQGRRSTLYNETIATSVATDMNNSLNNRGHIVVPVLSNHCVDVSKVDKHNGVCHVANNTETCQVGRAEQNDNNGYSLMKDGVLSSSDIVIDSTSISGIPIGEINEEASISTENDVKGKQLCSGGVLQSSCQHNPPSGSGEEEEGDNGSMYLKSYIFEDDKDPKRPESELVKHSLTQKQKQQQQQQQQHCEQLHLEGSTIIDLKHSVVQDVVKPRIIKFVELEVIEEKKEEPITEEVITRSPAETVDEKDKVDENVEEVTEENEGFNKNVEEVTIENEDFDEDVEEVTKKYEGFNENVEEWTKENREECRREINDYADIYLRGYIFEENLKNLDEEYKHIKDILDSLQVNIEQSISMPTEWNVLENDLQNKSGSLPYKGGSQPNKGGSLPNKDNIEQLENGSIDDNKNITGETTQEIIEMTSPTLREGRVELMGQSDVIRPCRGGSNAQRTGVFQQDVIGINEGMRDVRRLSGRFEVELVDILCNPLLSRMYFDETLKTLSTEPQQLVANFEQKSKNEKISEGYITAVKKEIRDITRCVQDSFTKMNRMQSITKANNELHAKIEEKYKEEISQSSQRYPSYKDEISQSNQRYPSPDNLNEAERKEKKLRRRVRFEQDVADINRRYKRMSLIMRSGEEEFTDEDVMTLHQSIVNEARNMTAMERYYMSRARQSMHHEDDVEGTMRYAPRLPQGVPSAPQSAPRVPQNVSKVPQNLSGVPQNVPQVPQNEPRVPQNAPRPPKHVYRKPQNVPRFPESVSREPPNTPNMFHKDIQSINEELKRISQSSSGRSSSVNDYNEMNGVRNGNCDHHHQSSSGHKRPAHAYNGDINNDSTRYKTHNGALVASLHNDVMSGKNILQNGVAGSSSDRYISVDRIHGGIVDATICEEDVNAIGADMSGMGQTQYQPNTFDAESNQKAVDEVVEMLSSIETSEEISSTPPEMNSEKMDGSEKRKSRSCLTVIVDNNSTNSNIVTNGTPHSPYSVVKHPSPKYSPTENLRFYYGSEKDGVNSDSDGYQSPAIDSGIDDKDVNADSSLEDVIEELLTMANTIEGTLNETKEIPSDNNHDALFVEIPNILIKVKPKSPNRKTPNKDDLLPNMDGIIPNKGEIDSYLSCVHAKDLQRPKGDITITMTSTGAIPEGEDIADYFTLESALRMKSLGVT